MTERIAVVGLGYVGLPVALAFARKFADTVGFDLSEARVSALSRNQDWTGEVTEAELEQSSLELSSDPADLRRTAARISGRSVPRLVSWAAPSPRGPSSSTSRPSTRG